MLKKIIVGDKFHCRIADVHTICAIGLVIYIDYHKNLQNKLKANEDAS